MCVYYMVLFIRKLVQVCSTKIWKRRMGLYEADVSPASRSDLGGGNSDELSAFLWPPPLTFFP